MSTEYELLKRDFLNMVSVKASEFIPKMYKALKKEGLSPEEIRQKLEEDLLDYISERTLLRNLPPEAKKTEHDPTKNKPEQLDTMSSSQQQSMQADGTILLGIGPSPNDPKFKKIVEDYKKTRDENKLLKSVVEEFWDSLCEEHRNEIRGCSKCGGGVR